MFNFLFDGKIGEILAPVTGTSQLYLSIQHHRNSEVQSLINAQSGYSLSQLTEGGVSPIHIACRYNNTFALDLILKQGVSVELADTGGNTPLHYASKYGHLELCKLLVSRGCSAAAKNLGNQSPYDITENHVIRQYLLPLQFQSERQSGMNDTVYGASSDSAYNSYGQIPINVPVSNPNSYPPPMQQHQSQQIPYSSQPPSAVQVQPPPMAVLSPNRTIINVNQPLPIPNNSLPHTFPVPISNSSLPMSQPPAAVSPAVIQPATTAVGSSSSSTGGSTGTTPGRTFQPDGFHSSASDPALQLKYGHVKAAINIAPPPTTMSMAGGAAAAAAAGGGAGGAPSYSMYSNNISPYSQPVATSLASRYVGYDAHTNQAVPSATASSVAAPPLPSFSLLSSAGSMQQQQQQQLHQPTQPPIGIYTPNSSMITTPPPPPVAAAAAAAAAVTSGLVPPPPIQMVTAAASAGVNIPQFQPLVKVFNPANETGEIVSLNSDSKAIL